MINQTTPTVQDYKDAVEVASSISRAMANLHFMPSVQQNKEIKEALEEAYGNMIKVEMLCDYHEKANDIQGRKQNLKNKK